MTVILETKGLRKSFGLSGDAGEDATTKLLAAISSGKNIIVSQVSANPSANDSIYFGFTTTILANFYGNGKSKKNGTTSSVGQLKFENLVATLPTDFLQISSTTTQTQFVKFTEPIVLTPGNCLFGRSGAVNLGLSVTLEWIEESNA